MNFDSILKLLNNPVFCVLLGSFLTGMFSIVVEFKKNSLSYSSYLLQKKEEFFIKLMDFLLEVQLTLENNETLYDWSNKGASQKLNEKFQQTLPLISLYGTPKIKKEFASLMSKLLSKIQCEKEFKYFIEQVSYELKLTKRNTLLMRILYYWNSKKQQKIIKIDNEKSFTLFYIKAFSEMEKIGFKNKKYFDFYKGIILKVCKLAKNTFSDQLIQEIESNVSSLPFNDGHKQLKKFLDMIACKFYQILDKQQKSTL